MTRSLHRLSASELKGKEPGKHADGGGLWFYKRPDGGAQWVLRYSLFSRRHEMGLGASPEVSLKEARQEGETWRAVVRPGTDAIKERERQRQEVALSIIAVHHFRNADADDPFDTVSGSTGLTGAANTTLFLTKTTDGVVLYGRGRYLPEFDGALGFDPGSCLWSNLGRPSDVFGSETRQAIRAALKAGKQTLTEIAEYGDLDCDLCAKTLQRMAEGGEIEKGGRGRYRLTPDPLSI